MAIPSYAWKTKCICSCLPQTSDSTPEQSMLLDKKMGGRVRSEIGISSETEGNTEEGAGLSCILLPQQGLRLKLWSVNLVTMNLVAMNLLKDCFYLDSSNTK